MSNHSSTPGDFEHLLRDVLGKPLVGATGKHPEGKLTPHDEGGIQFAVGSTQKHVVINFGTPVAWLAMPPQQAVQLAQNLISHAREVARNTGVMLTVVI